MRGGGEDVLEKIRLNLRGFRKFFRTYLKPTGPVDLLILLLATTTTAAAASSGGCSRRSRYRKSSAACKIVCCVKRGLGSGHDLHCLPHGRTAWGT